MNHETLTKVAQWVGQNKICVNVDRAFAFYEAGKALDYERDMHPRGKVVIEVGK